MTTVTFKLWHIDPKQEQTLAQRHLENIPRRGDIFLIGPEGKQYGVLTTTWDLWGGGVVFRVQEIK